MTPKEARWLEFSVMVAGHVRNYAVKQYGPDISESVDLQSAKDCFGYIAKWTRRSESGARGRIEQLRDCAKIAHVAQIAFDFLNPTEDEIELIRNGAFK